MPTRNKLGPRLNASPRSPPRHRLHSVTPCILHLRLLPANPRTRQRQSHGGLPTAYCRFRACSPTRLATTQLPRYAVLNRLIVPMGLSRAYTRFTGAPTLDT